MKVYAVPLAQAPVKENFARSDGDGGRRCMLTLGALLVDHPRGKLLVDAGLPDRPGLLDRAMGLSLTKQFRSSAYRSLPRVLREAGVAPEAITNVILTHLHWDHTGSVDSFRRARVLVGPGELAASRTRGVHSLGFIGARRARRFGLAEVRMHDWDEGGAQFPKAHDVFGDGAVMIVPTPGHTPGHVAVLLRTNPPLMYLGDASYTLAGLRAGATNGKLYGQAADQDRDRARRTLDGIQELEARLNLNLLPAHDTDAWQALPAFPAPLS